MPLRHLATRNISERDIINLREERVPESRTLDFKRDLIGPADAAKLEFVKDISALANTDGGDILFGVDEVGGLIADIPGVELPDVDGELLRLQQAILHGISPRPFGIDMHAVPLANGRHVLVVRVPKSWSGPHMVVRSGFNRIMGRHLAGNEVMSIDELRNAFARSEGTADRIRAFRDSRIQALATRRPRNGGGANSLLLVHVVPFQSLLPGAVIDVSVMNAEPNRYRLPLLSSNSTDTRFNSEGFRAVAMRGNPERESAYSQLYRNGAVELALQEFVRPDENPLKVHPHVLGPCIAKTIPKLLTLLHELFGIQPPVSICVSFLNCLGTYTESDGWFSLGPVDSDRVIAPDVIVQDFSREAVIRALRPPIDVLWNSVGVAESLYFDASGNWIGPNLDQPL